MAHDVFISHSTKDKLTADAICSIFENNGIRCWIAPRDIVPGMEWVDSIIDGISASQIMILVLSSNSNASAQVKHEVEQAVNQDVIIIPFRIEEVELSKSFKYYLSATHWMDALTPPIENHIEVLKERVKLLLPAATVKFAQHQATNAAQNTSPTAEKPAETAVKTNQTHYFPCPHCGAQNIINVGQVYADLYCQHCGKKVSSPPIPKPLFMTGWKLKGLFFLLVSGLIAGFLIFNPIAKTPASAPAEITKVHEAKTIAAKSIAVADNATAKQAAGLAKQQVDAKARQLAEKERVLAEKEQQLAEKSLHIETAQKMEQAEKELIGKDKNRQQAAFTVVYEQAKSGNSEAMRLLGASYLLGKGVAKNSNEGCRWYKNAAEQGHKEAKRFYEKLKKNKKCR